MEVNSDIGGRYSIDNKQFEGPNLLDNKEKPGDFYTWFGQYIQQELKPKAIVIISAHWQGEGKHGIFGMIISIYRYMHACVYSYVFCSGYIRQAKVNL